MVGIESLFGNNSSQTEGNLIISKADLFITPSVSNSAEALLAAIILKASKQYRGILTDPDGTPITDHTGEKITYDNRVLFEDTQLTYYDRYFPIGIIRDVFELLIFIDE